MKKLLVFLALAIICGGIYYAYQWMNQAPLPEGIASGNGRIEATEINIASKTAGRILELLVQEGDFVSSGQALAVMDTEQLEAQLPQAEA